MLCFYIQQLFEKVHDLISSMYVVETLRNGFKAPWKCCNMISNCCPQECEILDIIMKLCCKSKNLAFNAKLANQNTCWPR